MPYRWNLTIHALEQMTAMGVDREAVVDCIENPLASWPSDTKDGVMVARNKRLTIPYNPLTGDVITVLWTSHDWLPDRHLPPEEQRKMSGWVNLDAKASEKLLGDWGFVVKEDKGQTRLWFHPADKEQRLIPFTAPGSRRANGKGSWRSAANALGLSVNDLLKGPAPEQRVIIGALGALGPAFDDKPDPFGIAEKVKDQALTTAAQALDSRSARLTKIVALTPVQLAAYEAVEHEPLTAAEIGLLIERGKTVTNEIMNVLIDRGLVVSRPSVPDDGLPPGRPRLIYLAGDPGTEIPVRRAVPHEKTLPDSPAPVVEQTPEEAPMPAELAAVPEPAPIVGKAMTGSRVFEETPIVWPTGGIVIKDDQGNLYVARLLTEEGR